MRSAGILLPIFSIPSEYGIGSFSKEAYEFVDRLAEAGMTYWQILPMGPTMYGDSPYQSYSTFAGNPLFIDLKALIEEGVLSEEECETVLWGADPRKVDYDAVNENRFRLLRLAYARADITKDPEYLAFEAENGFWLHDYAIYMAVKERFDGKGWDQWAEDIRMRWQNAMDYYQRELYFEIEFHKYMQYTFWKQWKKLKRYANDNGVKIIGDIPIYVSYDSAEVWANPWLFQLDDKGQPSASAGCPPDAFSETGQVWGNPLYNWVNHRNSGYDWWLKRIEWNLKLHDVVRIDHFRGFDEYFSIPVGEENAVNGHWEDGPGMEFFSLVQERFGKGGIIAEDLGLMTDTVRKLVRDTGYPKMKVLEFAFDPGDAYGTDDHLPHNYETNCVAYTGTHDNNTLMGWYESLTKAEKAVLKMYYPTVTGDRERVKWELIRIVQSSVAKICIIPMGDYLGLGAECRINQPATVGGNWAWRMLPGEFTTELAEQIKSLVRIYGRLNVGNC